MAALEASPPCKQHGECMLRQSASAKDEIAPILQLGELVRKLKHPVGVVEVTVQQNCPYVYVCERKGCRSADGLLAR